MVWGYIQKYNELGRSKKVSLLWGMGIEGNENIVDLSKKGYPPHS